MLPNVAFGFAGNRNRRLRALIVMIVLIIKMRQVMIMMILSVNYFPENTFGFGFNENFDQKNQTDQVGHGDFEHSDGHCDS